MRTVPVVDHALRVTTAARCAGTLLPVSCGGRREHGGQLAHQLRRRGHQVRLHRKQIREAAPD